MNETEKLVASRINSIKRKNPYYHPTCQVCGKEFGDSLKGIEYVKTKRGTELFVHTECVRKWGE